MEQEAKNNGQEGDAAQLAADNVGDLISRNRVQQIFQARQEVRYAFRNLPLAEARGANTDSLSHVISAAVQSYLSEIAPLAHSADEDSLNYYWTEYPLGVQTIHPPRVREGSGMGVEISKVEGPFGEQSEPQPIEVEWKGLESVADADPPFSYSWRFHTTVRHGGDTVEQKRRQVTIPRHILRAAYQAANEFASEVDLDLQLEEGVQTREMDYSDPATVRNGHGGGQ